VSSQLKICPEFLHLVVDEEDMHNVVGVNMVGDVFAKADMEQEVLFLQEVDNSGSIP
jgi:hypothetical protein